MQEPKMADSYTQHTEQAGRWFAWHFRVHPDPRETLRPDERVLAWPLETERWEVIEFRELREGDRWLPLPGRPIPREKGGER